MLKSRRQVKQSKEPRQKNPYRNQSKPAGAPQCPTCRSVNLKGSWITQEAYKERLNGSAPKGTESKPKLLCPACKQLKEKYAMGVIELYGENFSKNKKTVINTIRRTEKIARSRNDQCRILWTTDINEAKNTKDSTKDKNSKEVLFKVYVSIPDLAQHIGRELEKSFKGTTEYSKTTGDQYIRVKWWSDLQAAAHEPGAPLRQGKKRLASETEKPRSRSFRGRGRSIE